MATEGVIWTAFLLGTIFTADVSAVVEKLPAEAFRIRSPYWKMEEGVPPPDEVLETVADISECECLTRCLTNNRCLSYGPDAGGYGCTFYTVRGNKGSLRPPHRWRTRYREMLAVLGDWCSTDEECRLLTGGVASCRESTCSCPSGLVPLTKTTCGEAVTTAPNETSDAAIHQGDGESPTADSQLTNTTVPDGTDQSEAENASSSDAQSPNTTVPDDTNQSEADVTSSSDAQSPNTTVPDDTNQSEADVTSSSDAQSPNTTVPDVTDQSEAENASSSDTQSKTTTVPDGTNQSEADAASSSGAQSTTTTTSEATSTPTSQLETTTTTTQPPTRTPTTSQPEEVTTTSHQPVTTTTISESTSTSNSQLKTTTTTTQPEEVTTTSHQPVTTTTPASATLTSTTTWGTNDPPGHSIEDANFDIPDWKLEDCKIGRKDDDEPRFMISLRSERMRKASGQWFDWFRCARFSLWHDLSLNTKGSWHDFEPSKQEYTCPSDQVLVMIRNSGQDLHRPQKYRCAALKEGYTISAKDSGCEMITPEILPTPSVNSDDGALSSTRVSYQVPSRWSKSPVTWDRRRRRSAQHEQLSSLRTTTPRNSNEHLEWTEMLKDYLRRTIRDFKNKLPADISGLKPNAEPEDETEDTSEDDSSGETFEDWIRASLTLTQGWLRCFLPGKPAAIVALNYSTTDSGYKWEYIQCCPIHEVP